MIVSPRLMLNTTGGEFTSILLTEECFLIVLEHLGKCVILQCQVEKAI